MRYSGDQQSVTLLRLVVGAHKEALRNWPEYLYALNNPPQDGRGSILPPKLTAIGGQAQAANGQSPKQQGSPPISMDGNNLLENTEMPATD